MEIVEVNRKEFISIYIIQLLRSRKNSRSLELNYTVVFDFFKSYFADQ